MAEDVRQWLRDLGCEHYYPIFVQNGFNSVSSLSGITESELDRMAVINLSHRQAILSKAQSGGDQELDFGDDFDAVLGDLTSAIADLEAISVPQPRTDSISTNPLMMDQVGPRRNTTGNISGSSSGSSTPLGGTPHNSLSRQEKKPIQGYNTTESSIQEGDFDLDALLDDLCEFDPMKEVGSNQPKLPVPLPVTPPVKHFPPSQPEPFQPPSPLHQSVMQPPPVRPKPTPNGVTPQQHQLTQVNVSPRHTINDNITDGNIEITPLPGMEEGPHVTPVHEPRLLGASDEITKEEVERRLEAKQDELRTNTDLSEEDVEAKMKEEKMKIALEKMKLASKRKEVIKVFNNDGSNKTVVVEEGMTAAVVCYLLVTKNHFEESPNWVLIERLGDVGLERELEDHEGVVDIYTHWARDCNNQFLFRRNDVKYELFIDPIKYFPMLLTNTMIGKDNKHRADKARKILVQEYFTSALRVPEIEGYLHLKDGYKNKWKKIYVILRASGIYQTLKGKSKTARNLSLLVQFDEYDLYRGLNFRKLLKAPSDFCFGLRPKPDQMVPGVRDIKVLCAESEEEFISWYAGIRLAKNGHTLYDNYYKAHVKQFKLEDAETSESMFEQKAYSLTGMRLEKHLDKKRELYQKEKEAREAQEFMFRTPNMRDEEEEQVPESPRVPPKPSPKPQKMTTGDPHHYPPPSQPAPPTPKSPPVMTPPQRYQEDRPVTPPVDDMSQFAWYHGAIPREEAVRRLEQIGGRDGVFLVRDSSSVPNSFVLTMFAKSVPKNFQIMPYEGPDGIIVYRIDDGPAFKSVDEILNHYHEVSDRLPCKLTEYCPRPPTRMTEC